MPGYFDPDGADHINSQVRKRVRQGYSVTRAPIGYRPTHVPGLYKPTKLGDNMKILFESIASDVLTIEEGLEALKCIIDGYRHSKIKQSLLVDILHNPYYSGFVTFNEEKYPGLHQRLISPEDQDYLIRLYNDAFKRVKAC